MSADSPSPKARRPRWRALVVVAAAAVLTTLYLAWDFAHFLRRPLAQAHEAFVYVVAPGASIRTIAQDLRKQGVLDNPFYWELYARATGAARRVQSGEYRIDATRSPRALLRQLTSGQVIQYSFTLVEGWTFARLRQALSEDPVLGQTLAEHSDAQIMAALGAADQHPEGWFLPDTYLFPRGTTDLDFLSRAYRAMRERLNAAWQARAQGLPLETPYEALILASIVERETAVASERATIAGVFVERLRRGMYLQTDPTVIYGMGDRYRGRIRYRDLRRDTPYNTYTRKGLPPTPIAMPSAESVHAALNPHFSGALFFVSRGDGTHEFSASLQEHNAAVIKYQLDGDASRLRGN